MSEFNPSDPKYKKVEDLPKEERGNYKDVEGGFVRRSAKVLSENNQKLDAERRWDEENEENNRRNAKRLKELEVQNAKARELLPELGLERFNSEGDKFDELQRVIESLKKEADGLQKKIDHAHQKIETVEYIKMEIKKGIVARLGNAR